MKVAEYRKLIKPRESDIQNECITYLESQDYYVQRLNAGGYKMAGGFVHGVKGGTPDIMAFKAAFATRTIHVAGEVDLVFIEVKVPGKLPTPLQVNKMVELIRHGARCLIARSVEELQEKL